jgi:hypothetical protein
VATHVIRLVKSQLALEQAFELFAMKMADDAKTLEAAYEGAFVTTNTNQGVVEVCITEGPTGPSLREYRLHMEPAFGKHGTKHLPEIELSGLEPFTR